MIKTSNVICFMHGTYAQSHVVQWSYRESVSQRICLTENISYSECLTARMSHTEHVEKKYLTLRSCSQTMCLTENVPH